jgi:hypothetical protein
VEPVSVGDLPLPQQWWLHVVHGKRCVVCGTKQNLEGHHVIERQVLKRELRGGALIGDRHFSLDELIWHPAGGVAVCELCHVRHTRAIRRIRADELPRLSFKFAELIGLSHRVGDRYYPHDNH